MEPVVLTSLPQLALAELLVGRLKAEGIPAYSDGGTLQDEFAVAQRAFGVRVYVPENRLAEAKKVLEATREVDQLDELDEPD